MKKKTKSEDNHPKTKTKLDSDLKIRLISSIFLFLFMVVYVGLAAIYTESKWNYKVIAAWFNFAFTLTLIGLAMYELMTMLNLGTKGTWYIIALGIFIAEILFVFPLDGHANQPAYSDIAMLSWLKWYVLLVVVLIALLSLFLLGYFTGSAIAGLQLMLYTSLIVLGFKGFSVIALSLNPHFGFNSIIFSWGTIILTDTFAYFGGKRFGKTKMAPQLSPKKTWEGFGIGVGVSVLIATTYGALFYYFLPKEAPFSPMLVNAGVRWVGLPGILVLLLAILISVTSQLGDLTFSYLKRYYGKKDYSNLIPGHGGILDRFDSFILVFMILYFIALSSSGTGVF